MGDNKLLKQFKISKRGPIASQLVGVIGGTHVPILSPDTDSKPDYYCRRQMYSISSQPVLDRKLLFSVVVTGFPVSMHDAHYNKTSDGHILDSLAKVIEGLSVRPLILGDATYPRIIWLLKLYPHNAKLSESAKKKVSFIWSCSC